MYISCWERKFHHSSTLLRLLGAKVPGYESSRERKFQGAKVPPMVQRKYVGTKVT